MIKDFGTFHSAPTQIIAHSGKSAFLVVIEWNTNVYIDRS